MAHVGYFDRQVLNIYNMNKSSKIYEVFDDRDLRNQYPHVCKIYRDLIVFDANNVTLGAFIQHFTSSLISSNGHMCRKKNYDEHLYNHNVNLNDAITMWLPKGEMPKYNESGLIKVVTPDNKTVTQTLTGAIPVNDEYNSNVSMEPIRIRDTPELKEVKELLPESVDVIPAQTPQLEVKQRTSGIDTSLFCEKRIKAKFKSQSYRTALAEILSIKKSLWDNDIIKELLIIAEQTDVNLEAFIDRIFEFTGKEYDMIKNIDIRKIFYKYNNFTSYTTIVKCLKKKGATSHRYNGYRIWRGIKIRK